MKTKQKNFTVVVIQWHDAAMHGTSRVPESLTKDYGLVSGFAAGILVHEDKKQITIATDFFPIQTNNDENYYRNLSSIPKSGIKNIERIITEFGTEEEE